MCKVSTKIQFCSCKTDIEKLKQFWALYRYDENIHCILVGEVMLPEGFSLLYERYNKATIKKLLNFGNPFDEPIAPKEKDKLRIHLTTPDLSNGCVDYAFEFKNKKWKCIEYDEFVFHADVNLLQFGKIKNSVELNSKERNPKPKLKL